MNQVVPAFFWNTTRWAACAVRGEQFLATPVVLTVQCWVTVLSTDRITPSDCLGINSEPGQLHPTELSRVFVAACFPRGSCCSPGWIPLPLTFHASFVLHMVSFYNSGCWPVLHLLQGLIHRPTSSSHIFPIFRWTSNIFHTSQFIFPAMESIIELGDPARQRLRFLLADGLPQINQWARQMLRLVAPNAAVVQNTKHRESKIAQEVCVCLCVYRRVKELIKIFGFNLILWVTWYCGVSLHYTQPLAMCCRCAGIHDSCLSAISPGTSTVTRFLTIQRHFKRSGTAAAFLVISGSWICLMCRAPEIAIWITELVLLTK